MTTQITARKNPEFQTTDNSEEYELGSKGEVNGAAVAGGIAGFCLGGPLGAGLAAAGAAYLAATKDRDAGDWARKSGKTLNDIGKSLVKKEKEIKFLDKATNSLVKSCLLYTSPSPRDQRGSRMPSSA